MKTLELYLNEQKQACIDNGIEFTHSLIDCFEQEWFDLLCSRLKNNETITQEIFDSLDEAQQWYLNKHYIIHGVKIIE